VNWADLMVAQGAFGTEFYDRSTRTIVGAMLWMEYRPVIKIGPKGALGSHEIRPIHSAPSLGQSIVAPLVAHSITPPVLVQLLFSRLEFSFGKPHYTIFEKQNTPCEPQIKLKK